MAYIILATYIFDLSKQTEYAPSINEPLHKVSLHQLQIKRKPTTALTSFP